MDNATAVPLAERFAKPSKVSIADIAFGGNTRELLPPYSEIPEEFKSNSNLWVKWQQKWFYSGLDSAPTPKAGIDGKAAMSHLAAVQGSMEPKHEHKQAGVAFLASLWFEKP